MSYSKPRGPVAMFLWTPAAQAFDLPEAKGNAVNRMRLMQVVSLMLYAGPLFAGLADFGWEMVWPFTGIFLMWQVVLRPADWPGDARRWAKPGHLAAAVARVAILAVVVALSFGVGRGLGGIVGFLPSIPPLAPLALSLAAIPLARLLWDPARAVEMEQFLDTAIRDIDALASGSSPDARRLAQATAQADRMLEPLALMPDNTPDETISAHLRAMGQHVDESRLRAALIARSASGAETPMVLQRALMLHASDGRLMEVLGGDNAAQAIQALPDTPVVLETLARRMAEALQRDPEVWWTMPSPETIALRADRMRGTPAEAALRNLIALTIQLAPPENPARP